MGRAGGKFGAPRPNRGGARGVRALALRYVDNGETPRPLCKTGRSRRSDRGLAARRCEPDVWKGSLGGASATAALGTRHRMLVVRIPALDQHGDSAAGIARVRHLPDRDLVVVTRCPSES